MDARSGAKPARSGAAGGGRSAAGRQRCGVSARARRPPAHQTQARSKEADAMRWRLTSPATPLDDDDILSQILLRLPPLPSSLPRASLVCRRWRRLVSDPHFLCSFREHHGKPPILGLFSIDYQGGNIELLDSADRIPATRFSLWLDDSSDCDILSCRHGRVLVVNKKRFHFLVWNPVTSDQHRICFPQPFGKMPFYDATIVCSAGNPGHVYGSCHSSPFQVVCRDYHRMCIYSSKTGAWGNLIPVVSLQDF